jgi:HK97 family phage prohead protease
MLSKDLGGFVERIAPGAFARSLANKSQDVKCLYNHNSDCVLGRLQNGTLTLTDSPYSLDFSCQLDEKQQAHKDLYYAVKRGDISECSFAFAIDRDGASPGEKFDSICTANGTTTLRTVLAASLFDVSAVTNPAYGNGATQVNARDFRSCDYAAARQILQTPASSVDAENRKRLATVERMIYSDKGFQAHIEDLLLQKRAKHIAEVIERDELSE